MACFKYKRLIFYKPITSFFSINVYFIPIAKSILLIYYYLLARRWACFCLLFSLHLWNQNNFFFSLMYDDCCCWLQGTVTISKKVQGENKKNLMIHTNAIKKDFRFDSQIIQVFYQQINFSTVLNLVFCRLLCL